MKTTFIGNAAIPGGKLSAAKDGGVPGSQSQQLASLFRRFVEVRGMPASVFIDREGKIFTIWPGILTADLLQEILGDMG